MSRVASLAFLLLLSAPLHSQDPRLQVPSSADQKKAEKLIKRLYQAEFRSRDPERQKRFAKDLVTQAEDPTNDAVSRYVLLREARDLAVGGRDLDFALEVVARLAKLFAVDALQMKAEVLSSARKGIRTPEEAAALAGYLLDAAGEALTAGDHDAALSLARDAERTAKIARDAALLARARKRLKEIPELKREADATAKVDLSTAIDVGDQTGNLNVGRYLCFVKGDWEKGLEYLLWAGDKRLQAVAEQELAPPADTASRLAVADGWLELARKQRSALQSSRCESRGLHWYQTALAEAKGLAKIEVERKLNELYRKGAPGRRLLLGPGLLGAWNLDEGRGASVLDASSRGNRGTLRNMDALKSWVEGDAFARSALQFDGNDDYVKIDGDATWNRIDKALTVAAWVYLTEEREGTDSVVSRQHRDSDEQYFHLGINDRELVGHLYTSDGETTLDGNTPEVPVRKWVHLALTFDGTTGRLYMDGKEVYSEGVTGTFPDDKNPVIIGGNEDSDEDDAQECFPGRIARVRIFNRALSGAEVSALKLRGR